MKEQGLFQGLLGASKDPKGVTRVKPKTLCVKTPQTGKHNALLHILLPDGRPFKQSILHYSAYSLLCGLKILAGGR
jgi:hypothetical protein